MNLERFDELYERYCDASLTPAERKEFLDFLDNPLLRARFVELSTFEAVASDETRVAQERKFADVGKWVDTSASDEGRGLEKKEGSSRRQGAARLRRSPEPRSPWPLAAAAAGVFLGFVALIAVASGGGRSTPAKKLRTAPVAEAARTSEPGPAIKREAPPPAEKRPVAVEPAARDPQPHREAEPPRPAVREPEVPAQAPPPAAPAAPVSAPKPEPAVAPREKETIAFIGQLERVQGEVQVVNEREKVPAESGKGLQAGQGVAVGRGAQAVVKFTDGTRMELGTETVVSRISEGSSAGKTVQVEQGFLAVETAKQPAARPMVVATQFAESTILGTQFTLLATAAFTRLDVKEGRVKFTRLQGVTSVIVAGGHYAIAGPGYDLAVKPAPALWKAPAQGLLLWLRADAGVKSVGGGVPAWLDQSGGNNHATQPAAACQPVLVPNAVGGRPALRFDGIDDFFHLPPGFNDFRAGLSAFVVVRVAAAPLWMRFLDFGQAPCANNLFFGRKDSAQSLCLWVYANGQTRGKVDAPRGLILDQFQQVGAVMGPQGNVTLYRNGSEVGAGVTSEPMAVTRRPNYIGKSNYDPADAIFKGEICEILFYGRAVSEAERVYIEGYLAGKYFDPTAPPAFRPGEK